MTSPLEHATKGVICLQQYQTPGSKFLEFPERYCGRRQFLYSSSFGTFNNGENLYYDNRPIFPCYGRPVQATSFTMEAHDDNNSKPIRAS